MSSTTTYTGSINASNTVNINKLVNIIENILYPEVNIEYLENYDKAKFGEIKYSHLGDCCFDLRNCDGNIELRPNKSILIGTGIKIELPNNDFFELQVRPRSGIANKCKIIILNSPGTVDSRYRGEVLAGLYNLSDDVYFIKYGDRITQAKVAFVPRPIIKTVIEVNNNTGRGKLGFGSTGIK